MKKLAVLALTVTLSLSIATAPLSAHAMGKPQAGQDQANALLDTALTLAILYGKTDPRVGPVLTALGINSAQDIKNLFKGDQSGANFNNIISFALASYAAKNPKVAAILEQLGIRSFADIQALISGQGDRSAIFQLAYDAISANPKYSQWLFVLGINGPEDLQSLVDGGIRGGNLQDLLFKIGLAYLMSKGKINGTDFVSQLNLGAFQGLPTSEISQIVKTAKAAKK